MKSLMEFCREHFGEEEFYFPNVAGDEPGERILVSEHIESDPNINSILLEPVEDPYNQFDYPSYRDQDELQFHQSYDEFVVPVTLLTDDEDDELIEARNHVRNYRKNEKGMPTSRVAGSIPIDVLEGRTNVNLERLNGAELDVHESIDEPVEFNEIDELGGLESSSSSEGSEYYNSSDYGSNYSNSDEEYKDEGLRRKNTRARFDAKAPLPVFCLDMIFESPNQFREAITRYAMIKGLDVRLTQNTKHKLRATCQGKEGCPWELYVSDIGTGGNLIVKTYKSHHHCRRSNKIRRANSRFLAEHYKTYVMIHPAIKVSDLQKLARVELHLKVSFKCCRNAKRRIIKELIGDYTKQYARLYDYVQEIRESNPGTSCFAIAKKLDDNTDPTFFRFYVCFEALKKGWKEGCRKIIGLDGCFLKGICKGQLLCAVGRDGNNQMYPIAWGVCEVENTENWSWFLTHLKADLDLLEGDGITFISDMQKGLIVAVRTILPEAYHRMCARHIYVAWSKGFRGEERKIAFWGIAKSTYMATLTENVKNLKTMGEGIFEALTEYPMHTWVKAFFTTDCKSDVVDNNLCETFNGTILIARTKPLVSMLDEIRQQTMKRFAKKRSELKNWRGKVSPKALEKLSKNELLSHDWEVVWNGDKGFDVTYIFYCDKRHTVFLDIKKCSCREWDLTGIPCPHAIACIQDGDGEPEDYVADWYNKEKYMKAYGNILVPIRGLDMLENKFGGCLPPPFKVSKGRPKKNRRKDPTEEKQGKTEKLPRVGIQMRCSLCRDPKHNYRKCPMKKDNPEYIPPSRKKAMARANAIISSNSTTAGLSSQVNVAIDDPSMNHEQFDIDTSRMRFRTSTEANLRADICEAIEFAKDMTAPRSGQKKAREVLKLAQLKELSSKKKKKNVASNSHS